MKKDVQILPTYVAEQVNPTIVIGKCEVYPHTGIMKKLKKDGKRRKG